MLTRMLSATAISALTVTAGLAQESDTQALNDLQIILDAMPGADQVSEVSYFDMSSNGQVEALVKMNGNCDQGYCEWKLFAEREDGWQAVGGGLASSVKFEPTEGSGAVINADDITYAYSGAETIYMWGDLLQGQTPQQANNDEYAMVGASTPYDQTSRIRLEKFELDLNGDDVPERIFLIAGLFYKVGQWGTPYAIFDANNELILSGVSTDMPKIFPKSETSGSVVIEVVPAGLRVSEIN
ncbi:hypothetical protein KUV57_12840 [Epibacterium sp. DP7N7-1]|nr:hypothetical protein [Epibacterium sp. DP7N7-1]